MMTCRPTSSMLDAPALRERMPRMREQDQFVVPERNDCSPFSAG